MKVDPTFLEKHVLVTGGSSGVGKALAMAFAEAGAKVTITGRNLNTLKQVSDLSPNIAAYQADVSDYEDLRRAIKNGREKFGPFSIAIANAGQARSMPFTKLTPEDFGSMIEVNLNGAFNTFKLVCDDMMDLNWGRMIGMGSIYSLQAGPYVAHYVASKHGLLGLMRAISFDMRKYNVTANTICPGYIDTPMTDRTIENIIQKTGMNREQAVTVLTEGGKLGRLVEPQEIVDEVFRLCDTKSDKISGQTIEIY